MDAKGKRGGGFSARIDSPRHHAPVLFRVTRNGKKMTHTAYISLGGNMGNERAIFKEALRRIASWKNVRVGKKSSIYRTEPQGDTGQNWFLNQVVELFCDGISPDTLLNSLLALENALGRERDPGRRYGPRRLDLDLLVFGDIVLQSERLTLPHPRMLKRAFVLVPLLEIFPEATLPGGGGALRLYLDRLDYRVEDDVIHQTERSSRMESPKKILGVLGGMGPAAGAEFMRLLAVKAPASIDQEHPVIHMISDPHIPDRIAAMLGTGADPTERVKKRLFEIAAMGVDFLAVPCNTAHIYINRFRDELPVKFIHIVEETVTACKKQSPKGAWLLATEATCKSRLYQDYAKEIGYAFREVSPEMQKRVTEALTLVKAGKMAESGGCMRDIVRDLWAVEELGIATACTELPLAYDASGLPREKSVSSLGALSDACLHAVYGDKYPL